MKDRVLLSWQQNDVILVGVGLRKNVGAAPGILDRAELRVPDSARDRGGKV